jgi:hypothetical protein
LISLVLAGKVNEIASSFEEKLHIGAKESGGLHGWQVLFDEARWR